MVSDRVRPTFSAGYRDLPVDPTRGADMFNGWWTTEPDGAGDPFNADTTLPGIATNSDPVTVTVHAWWLTETTLSTGLPDDTATTTAGEPISFTPIITGANGEPYPSDPATWTITDADDDVDATIDPTTGEITIISTITGDHQLVLTIPTADGDVIAAITITVTPGDPTRMTLVASADTVDQGGSITITATGTDTYGNPTGDITGDVDFTSDVATDVVDANTITFPTASLTRGRPLVRDHPTIMPDRRLADGSERNLRTFRGLRRRRLVQLIRWRTSSGRATQRSPTFRLIERSSSSSAPRSSRWRPTPSATGGSSTWCRDCRRASTPGPSSSSSSSTCSSTPSPRPQKARRRWAP